MILTDQLFTKTCETSYAYINASSTQLDLKTELCYSPADSLISIGILILVFVVILFMVVKLFKK